MVESADSELTPTNSGVSSDDSLQIVKSSIMWLIQAILSLATRILMSPTTILLRKKFVSFRRFMVVENVEENCVKKIGKFHSMLRQT